MRAIVPALLLALFALALFQAAQAKPAFDEVRLSDVSVLLPYNNKVSHVIEAFNGCFEWCAFSRTRLPARPLPRPLLPPGRRFPFFS